MKKTFFVILALLPALFGWQCQKEKNKPGPELSFDCAETPTVCELSKANNDFGFKIFKKLHEQDSGENLFISPTSIATALTMTLNGAQGQTADEMKSALELNGFTLDEVNAAYKVMLNTMPSLDNRVDLKMANSIWYREGFSVKPPFLDVNRDYFGSEVNALDFRDPAAKNTINGWVNNKTKGLIDKIIEEIPGNAVMYLINAIYFKGDWTRSFKEDVTQQAPFYRADNSQTPVQMMGYGETVKFPLYTSEAFYAIDLPYGDSVYSMTLLVPRGDNTAAGILPQLNGQTWQQIIAGMSVQEMDLKIPKFKMTYEKTLNQALQSLGIQTAFQPGTANFSNIAEAELYIDEVKHKAFVEVDEKGTKAAAVTSVGIGVTSVPSYPTIILDRPFLFAIRENQAGNVLFLGKLMDPDSE